MDYLVPEEYSKYATEFPITASNVSIASKLIDSYCGRSFGNTQVTEQVTLNKKKLTGKLKHSPVISILSARFVSRLPSGKSYETVNVDDIDYTEDGYFAYYGAINAPYPGYGAPTTAQIFGCRMEFLEVTYSYGWEGIPDDIKYACGMISQNIAQAKQFNGVKEISDFDGKIVMFNDGFLPSDIRMMLNRYRRV